MSQDFDVAFAKYGGRFDPSTLPNAWRQVFDETERHANAIIAAGHVLDNGSSRAVVFGYVNNMEINAIAHEQRLIGVFAGTVKYVVSLFMRMLADPYTLPGIGNSSAENADLPPFNLEDHEVVLPRDTIRRIYASHLIRIALEFLIRHELAHVMNGHLELLRSQAGLESYLEIGTKPVLEITALDLQTLECDADSSAGTFSLESLISGLEISGDFMAKISLPNVKTIEQLKIHDHLFAIYSLFLLFEDSATDEVSLSERSHPPAVLRQYQILTSTYEALVHQRLTQLASWLWGNHTKITIHSDFAFAKVHGRLPERTKTKTVLNVAKLSRKISDNWSGRLFPLLQPVAGGGLSKPSKELLPR